VVVVSREPEVQCKQRYIMRSDRNINSVGQSRWSVAVTVQTEIPVDSP
jgi:hypothetical protein